MAPTVISPNADRSISALYGNSVTHNFQIINANPSVTADQIEWYFNNSLALRDRTTLYGNTLVFSGDFRRLTISDLNYDIAGRFSVTARNLVGSSSDYVNLIVEGNCSYIYVHTYNNSILKYVCIYHCCYCVINRCCLCMYMCMYLMLLKQCLSTYTAMDIHTCTSLMLVYV